MSIVITGNPGVGKHTITKKISEILNFPIIDINVIAKDSGLFEKNENTNDVDTQMLGKILKGKHKLRRLKTIISSENKTSGSFFLIAGSVSSKNKQSIISSTSTATFIPFYWD